MTNQVPFALSRAVPTVLLLALVLLATPSGLFAQGGPGGGGPGGGGPGPIPPVPVPPENPLTPAKVVLGKMLFWDAQLSTDDTVACATCHLPEFGGSDPRSVTATHPGFDGTFGNADDIFGSPGIAVMDCGGTPAEDATFGWERQVTARKTPSMINAAFSPTLFWDGRATGTFVDPETGTPLIAAGGALESQAVGPLVSSVEMACGSRSWVEIRTKLETVTPLFFASDLTPDIVAALGLDPTYPDLFEAAFGTPEITAGRIGFAMASYQRTLISDQSPFDAFLASGPTALTPQQNQGRQVFIGNCLPCHGGPLQSNHAFFRIGVRPTFEDLGRGAITGIPQDNGRFKTPNLRNVALRAPYFHNGGKQTLAEVIDFYDVGGDFPNPAIAPLGLSATEKNLLEIFLTEALTDPRVAAGLPPFDHPTLRPYFRRGDANGDAAVDISDPIAVLEALFEGGVQVTCADAADANDDGQIDIADVIATLGRLFTGDPPLPSPSDRSTGPDPTFDTLGC